MCQLVVMPAEKSGDKLSGVACELESETRADVCEDCQFMHRREPLTCKLTRRLKGGRLEPCPQLLAAKMATPGTHCPSPDQEVARRWNAAATTPMPEAVARRAIELASQRTAEETTDRPGGATPHRNRRGFARQPFYVA